MSLTKVLVTGASGHIGQVVRRLLGSQYSLCLLDRREPIPASPDQETVVADLADYDAVLKAMQDVQAVVHLGADSSAHAPWASVLQNNILATYNVLEAARSRGVAKVVVASSHHASAGAVREFGQAGLDMPVRPDTLYGVSKVFGETLGRYYADQHGLSVICLRIGSCHGSDDPQEQRELLKDLVRASRSFPYVRPEQNAAMWISNRDMAQLVQKSLEAKCRFGIFYGSSDNHPAIFDLTDTKVKLGYAPQDHVQDLLWPQANSLRRAAD